MNHRRFRELIVGCALLLMPMSVAAQTLRPTPKPLVTAENELWVIEGRPLAFAGSLYEPAGAEVFFNANEMVRSGEYRGVPLYAIRTREPNAVLFVPLSRGLMKPYGRRGELDAPGTMSPAPPVVEGPFAQVEHDDTGWITSDGTFERLHGPRAPLGSLATAQPPTGLNAFYVEHDGRRWFSSGPAVAMAAKAFSRAGDYRGFTVYVAPGDKDTIYIPVALGADLLTPYSVRR